MAVALAKKSTTVRFEPPRLLRAGLRVTSAASPKLAARAAERLFLTPPRHSPPAREREALAPAERFYVRAGGARLACWRLGDGLGDDPAVLLVHGWGGRSGQLATLAAAIREAGCAAILVDGPAHGASSGRTSSVVQVAEAIEAVAARVGARAAVAHSMGAAALGLALRDGLALDAAVLVGAPRSPVPFFSRFADALELTEEVRIAVLARLAHRFGLALQDLDLAAAARELTTPVLVVHDRRDAEVPFDDGAAIAGAWPGARLVETDGLGHRAVLRDRGVARAVADFVVGRLPRCSCGRFASSEPGSAGRCAGCVLAADLFDRDGRPHPTTARA